MKRNIMETNIISELTTFIEHAPTAFHAVAELKGILNQEGFEELKESEKWKIEPGKRYYVTRNNSSIIAVKAGTELDNYSFHVTASHSDSPTFKLKENAEIEVAKKYTMLNTEGYGGMICSTWFDRPLSLAGMVWFVMNWKNLQGQGIKPFKYLTDENGNIIGETHKGDDKGGAKEPLTKLERNRVIAIILVSALSVIFWLFYYQQDLALVIYMTDYINMNLGSFAIAPSWITTTWNGLLCVALGGVMAAIWKKLAARPQGDMNMFKKVGLGFLFVGLAFGVMALCEMVRGVGADASVKASVLWPVLFSTVITIGEMCFSPLRNAFVSKYAPKKYLSLLMGVIAISTFGANKLSPFVQAFIEKFDVFPVFVGICAIMLVFTVLLFAANQKLNSLVEGEEE